MTERIPSRGRPVGRAALLLARSTVVFLGVEVGAGSLLHVAHSAWLTLLVCALLYLGAFFLLALMVPGMEVPKSWGVVALIVVPIGALVVLQLTYSGLDQRVLHAHGRVEPATVTDVYWVDQGADPPTHVAELADLSGQPIPGKVSGDGLRAGQSVTVTVDPQGKIPVMLGTPSTGSGEFRTAGLTAGVEILCLALATYQGAADRSAKRTKKATGKPRRTRKPEDAPA